MSYLLILLCSDSVYNPHAHFGFDSCSCSCFYSGSCFGFFENSIPCGSLCDLFPCIFDHNHASCLYTCLYPYPYLCPFHGPGHDRDPGPAPCLGRNPDQTNHDFGYGDGKGIAGNHRRLSGHMKVVVGGYGEQERNPVWMHDEGPADQKKLKALL
ncbi:hypothetical protein HanXRQr2_Chr08g0329621 [Helianthus annuus]|uniref:Uncharacterized protein n=1 Tax=Helianthus annuus TaxID=4232 RepID=A0A9K3IDH3_HELAN|nr:hypothetical protein HanXRQr2_Chr08g0329621 [Helianthus annuus]KAJ0900873.1 hypothetical protein HanPSC8_Chr08g0318721 [Helianthus annuus]